MFVQFMQKSTGAAYIQTYMLVNADINTSMNANTSIQIRTYVDAYVRAYAPPQLYAVLGVL